MHLTWENEAHLEVAETGGEVEIVYPPISFLAEPPSPWSTPTSSARARARSPRRTSTSCTPPKARRSSPSTSTGRPTPETLKKHVATFPEIELFPVTAVAKDWDDANAKFFAEGELFD